MSKLILYHGSPENFQTRVFGKRKSYNDYGKDFYCTEHMELAEKVGVNLRTLPKYKIRAKDINIAAGVNLLALAKALDSRVEDLLEYDSSEIVDN